jgi:hypothetical protein
MAESNDNVFLLTDDFYIVAPDELYDSIDHLTDYESKRFTEHLGAMILSFEQNLD